MAVVKLNRAAFTAELEGPRQALQIYATLRPDFDRAAAMDVRDKNRYLQRLLLETAYMHHALALKEPQLKAIHLDEALVGFRHAVAMGCGQNPNGDWFFCYDLVRFARLLFDRGEKEKARAVLDRARTMFPERDGSWELALEEMLLDIDAFLNVGVDWVSELPVSPQPVACEALVTL